MSNKVITKEELIQLRYTGEALHNVYNCLNMFNYIVVTLEREHILKDGFSDDKINYSHNVFKHRFIVKFIVNNMEQIIIRQVKQNKANGQRSVSVGKLAKENDFVIIRKLNLEVAETSAKIETAIPQTQNDNKV